MFKKKIGKGETVYIAGPMTGIHDYNRREFFNAEKKLKKLGFDVLSPAYFPDGLFYHQYIDMGLRLIKMSNAVVVLPGWEDSKGANIEVDAAKKEGKQILKYCEIVRKGK